MKRRLILCLMIIVLCVTSGVAQTTDLRKVDFANFTYQSSLCAQEYGRQGIGKAVRVRNGEFKSKNVYFAVDTTKIIYADVTGDGREEAIVSIDCGAITANFSRTEIYIYTIKNDREALLAAISDKNMERDYSSHYPDAGSYWGVNENGLKIGDGTLGIDVLADGSHAAPKYIVALEYRVSEDRLRLVGKPQRRLFRQ